MIEIVPMPEFLISIGRAKLKGMDLSLYFGRPYECACGKLHTLEEDTELLCHGYWQVVAACPEDPHYLTRVKVRMFMMVKFLGFEGLNGTRIQGDADMNLLVEALLKFADS